MFCLLRGVLATGGGQWLNPPKPFGYTSRMCQSRHQSIDRSIDEPMNERINGSIHHHWIFSSTNRRNESMDHDRSMGHSRSMRSTFFPSPARLFGFVRRVFLLPCQPPSSGFPGAGEAVPSRLLSEKLTVHGGRGVGQRAPRWYSYRQSKLVRVPS